MTQKAGGTASLSEIEEKIVCIIFKISGKQKILKRINSKTDILNGVGFSSLQLIEFVLEVEESFQIAINFDEFDYEHLKSIAVFAQYISKYI